MGVLRHAWTCPKWQQIVSQFYLKNELSYEVSFLHVVIICKNLVNLEIWWGKGGWGQVRRDLVTFWLIGGALTQTGCNEKPCSPKIFKANQIAWFFYTKFKHHDQHQNQHHDWNLLNKFWLLITFGVLPKVSFKVKFKVSLKVKFFKIQNIILLSVGRHEW